jgi:hypothetical protein
MGLIHHLSLILNKKAVYVYSVQSTGNLNYSKLKLPGNDIRNKELRNIQNSALSNYPKKMYKFSKKK